MKKIISMLFCSLLLIGCSSDFLDKTPVSNANEENFYKSQKDIETALWSAYNSLYLLNGPESLPSFYGELMSDNAYSDNAAGRIQDYESFELHTMTIDNELVFNFWNNYYKSIYIVNNIITSAEKLDFANRDALIG